MADYIYYGENVSPEDLEHYGVLGMKWGIRRGHATEAYAKGIRKKRQLEAKADSYKLASAKQLKKAAKYDYKANKTRNEAKSDKMTSKSKKLYAQAYKDSHKAEKYRQKAKKWTATMDSVFADYDIKVIKNGNVKAEKGKKFIEEFGPDIFEVTLKPASAPNTIEEKRAKHSDDSNYLAHYGVPGMKWYQHLRAKVRVSQAHNARRKAENLEEADRLARAKEAHRRSVFDQQKALGRVTQAQIDAEKGRQKAANAIAKSRTIAIKDAKQMSAERRARAESAVNRYKDYLRRANASDAQKAANKKAKMDSKIEKAKAKVELAAAKQQIKTKAPKTESSAKADQQVKSENQNGQHEQKTNSEYVKGETVVRSHHSPNSRTLSDKDLDAYKKRLETERAYNQMAHPIKTAIADAANQSFKDVSKRASNLVANHMYNVGLKKVNYVLETIGRDPLGSDQDTDKDKK